MNLETHLQEGERALSRIWKVTALRGVVAIAAAWGIALGIFEIALAFVLPISGGRSLLIVLGGLLAVAFGVIMKAIESALLVSAAALLMMQAGIAKRQLAWRPRRTKRERRRRL